MQTINESSERKKISVVVPLYNEEQTVAELHRCIVLALQSRKISYEIIFVDDGSTDNTFNEAKKLKPIKLISLQTNGGQTTAIDVGIQKSVGEIIVLLDADLQNDPAEIPLLLEKIENGCDVVIGNRIGRKDIWTRMLFSRFANFFARLILGVKVRDFGSGLKVYRSRFIKHFQLLGESQVFLAAVAKERGAVICEVPVTYHPRQAGISKVKVSKMLKSGLDLIGVAFFVKYFSNPLRFFGGWGLFFIFLSLVDFAVTVVFWLLHTSDFTEIFLLVFGALFVILGVLLFMMGFLAEMLLRVYYNNKDNTPYLIKNIINNGK
jgi:glycosyltransferase involved in cell wall biosynthesis